MGPLGHTVVSTAVGGGVWAATGSFEAGALTLAVGVLMDLDHAFDYYQWYIRRRQDKIYILLHAWEYSIIGLAVLISVFYHSLFLAAVAAHLSHVITDHLHNGMSPWGYSIIYRIIKRFDASIIAPKHSAYGAYRQLIGILPFGKRLAPWFHARLVDNATSAEESPP